MRALVFWLFVILLAMPAAILADDDEDNDYRLYQGWSVTGTVVSVDRDDEVLEIYDRSHRHYKILAEDAKVYEGERERRIRDIESGDMVGVYGYERREHVIEATVIRKLDHEDDWYGKRRGEIRVYGTVKKVDERGGKLHLTVDGRTQKIKITRETEIYSSRDRRANIDRLREGDIVRVEGYRSKGNEIAALAIYVGDSYDWGAGRYRGQTIHGRVIQDTTFFNRKLRVVPLDRNDRIYDAFDVEVPKDAEVVKHGRNISVHEIRTGDIINAEGHWDGSRFTAIRISVNDSDGAWREYDRDRDYRTIEGRIERIDYSERQFTLDTGADERKVYADRARIWVNGDTCRFEDIRRGDEVRVRGNTDGRSIDAERIEIIRTHRHDDRYYY